MKIVFIWFLVLFFSSWIPRYRTSSGRRHCAGNDVKKRYMCNCHEGNAVTSMSSSFDHGSSDRLWNISCSTSGQYKAKSSSCEGLVTKWTSPGSDFDLTFKSHDYECLFKHGFLTGVESEFDSKYKDRSFRFTYAVPSMWSVRLDTCRDRVISSYQTDGHYELLYGQVVHGIKSAFSGKYSDRIWTITVCKIASDCDEIRDITFESVDHPEDFVSLSQIKRESQVTDATEHSGDIEAVLTLSSETSKSLTESMRFESTSSSSIDHSASVSVSVSANIDLPCVELETSVETGYQFRKEKMTSKTWSRETQTEYSESNGKQMEWMYVCQAGTRCEAVVTVYQAVVSVPYTMRVNSRNSMVQCTEKGIYERRQTFTKFHVHSTKPNTTTLPTTVPTSPTTFSSSKQSSSSTASTAVSTSTAPSVNLPTSSAPSVTISTVSSEISSTSGSTSGIRSTRSSANTTTFAAVSASLFHDPTDEPHSDNITIGAVVHNEHRNSKVTTSSAEEDTHTVTIGDISVDEGTARLESDSYSLVTNLPSVPRAEPDENSDTRYTENQQQNNLAADQGRRLTEEEQQLKKLKSSLLEENLTTKVKKEMSPFLGGKGSPFEVLDRKEPCEEKTRDSLCQKLYGCLDAVPNAAKITAYMLAMAVSVAMAIKLSSALMV